MPPVEKQLSPRAFANNLIWVVFPTLSGPLIDNMRGDILFLTCVQAGEAGRNFPNVEGPVRNRAYRHSPAKIFLVQLAKY